MASFIFRQPDGGITRAYRAKDGKRYARARPGGGIRADSLARLPPRAPKKDRHDVYYADDDSSGVAQQ